MSQYRRALILIPLLALVAADAAPTKVVRVCSIDGRSKWAIVANPDSLERQTVMLHSSMRHPSFSGEADSPLMKITLVGTGRDVVIKEITPYAATEAQQQRDAYVFVSMETVGTGVKASTRLKLTRFESPVDVIIPPGADTAPLLQRAAKFKKGDVVTARFKGADSAVYDLDIARPLVRGVYLKDADAIIDGKKFPGILLDVEGEQIAFALPPAGQKNRTGDADALGLCRKLKKGIPLRLTCDSERPGVIRAIEPDLTILPLDDDDLLLQAPAISLQIRMDPQRGSVYAYLSPAPATEADADLLVGFRQSRLDDDAIVVPPEQRSQVYRRLGEFNQPRQVQEDHQAISDRLLRFTMGRPFDPKRILGEVGDIALEASQRYRHEMSNTYADIRLILGKDLAAKLQKRGRELRSRGETGYRWNN